MTQVKGVYTIELGIEVEKQHYSTLWDTILYLCQSLSSADGCALLCPIVFQFPGHTPVLRYQLKQLGVRHALGLTVEHV